MPADETQLLYSLCLHGRGELGLAPDEYAALTMVLLRLLAFKPAGGCAGGQRLEKKTLKTCPSRTARRAAPPAPRRSAAPERLRPRHAPRPPRGAPAAPVAPVASPVAVPAASAA